MLFPIIVWFSNETPYMGYPPPQVQAYCLENHENLAYNPYRCCCCYKQRVQIHRPTYYDNESPHHPFVIHFISLDVTREPLHFSHCGPHFETICALLSAVHSYSKCVNMYMIKRKRGWHKKKEAHCGSPSVLFTISHFPGKVNT